MVLILWSFSSSPSLSFCHSVMPPFLSLYITLPFLSLYHAVSVHCFAGTLLCPFFFFFFATLLGAWCLGGEKTWESRGKYIFCYFGMISEYIHDFEFFFWCLVFGCWENVEKQREIGFFSPLWSIWFLRNWKQPKAGRTKPIEIQLVRCRCQIW